MAFRVLEVQPTPNPNAMKFVLDRPIAEQPTSFLNPATAEGHSIASRFFAIPGVSSLLLLGDFVTVNKTADASWADIRDQVQRVLSEV
jgi:NFU1 iron-sulfur cluster scaffold homolog, mitochondrial